VIPAAILLRIFTCSIDMATTVPVPKALLRPALPCSPGWTREDGLWWRRHITAVYARNADVAFREVVATFPGKLPLLYNQSTWVAS
jgi:hypothetical protein